jgi:hypothetical protein
MTINEKLISDVHGIVIRLAGSDLPVPHDLAELVQSVSRVVLRFMTERRNHTMTPEKEQNSLHDIHMIARRFEAAGHANVANFIRDKFYFSEGTSIGEAVTQQRVETVEIPSAKIATEEEPEEPKIAVVKPAVEEFSLYVEKGPKQIDQFEMSDYIPATDELVLQPFESNPSESSPVKMIVKKKSKALEKQFPLIDKIINKNGQVEFGSFSNADLPQFNFGTLQEKAATKFEGPHVSQAIQEGLKQHQHNLSLVPISAGRLFEEKSRDGILKFSVSNELMGLYLGNELIAHYHCSKVVEINTPDQQGKVNYSVFSTYKRKEV